MQLSVWQYFEEVPEISIPAGRGSDSPGLVQAAMEYSVTNASPDAAGSTAVQTDSVDATASAR